ncbi:hypothetical protein RFN25_25085 [Mesorhizobium abyssinicae]|uniref:hypothetical protein n=1 Tax=Mesorhizobium abyssinicae TaxID=1209958 RepID=UPI002A248F09|nr:hypothetical protein [Mesorhizobium abyssinicae]MDX8436703.1 hypothetical protein [Mesorhizobium abyssinicae]
MNELVEAEVANLKFNALRNALYHTARRKSFERWNRVFNFTVVLLGAAAIGDVLRRFGVDQSLVGVGVALVGAAQLVFDFGRSARDHQALQRDYYNVLAEIEECTDPDTEKCALWRSRMTKIAADEPPTLRALDAKAYNDALDAMDEIFGYQSDDRLVVPFSHRVLGGLLYYDGYRYPKIRELPGYKPRIEAPAE